MEISSLFSDEESAVSNGESGWTMYFEDFMSSKMKEEEMKEDEGSNGCSMKPFVSDVSSSAWKFAAMAEIGEGRKKLSFKKGRARGVLDDDSLEDTATSPMNSPKVSDVLKFNQMKKAENGDSPLQEKGAGFENFREQRDDEMGEMGLFQNGNECSELKKRGLCLVPMSMLVDYLE